MVGSRSSRLRLATGSPAEKWLPCSSPGRITPCRRRKGFQKAWSPHFAPKTPPETIVLSYPAGPPLVLGQTPNPQAPDLGDIRIRPECSTSQTSLNQKLTL